MCRKKKLEGTFEGGRTAELVREREKARTVQWLQRRPRQAPCGAPGLERTFSVLPCQARDEGDRLLHSTSDLVLDLHCPEKGHNLGQDSSLQTKQFLGSAEAVSNQQPLLPAAGNIRE